MILRAAHLELPVVMVSSRELDPQQFRVLQMLDTGLLSKQIGYELGVSEAGIKAQMTAILRDLGANNCT